MISANSYVKVEFDDEGRKKIEEAWFTINTIVGALKKNGGQTSAMEGELEQAMGYLQAILDGVIW